MGIKVLVDPKGEDFTKYRNSYLIKPNLKELETIVGKIQNTSDMVSKSKKLINELNISYLLVTCSADGMYLICNDTHVHVKHKPIEVFDVTGAGDTVIATLSVFMAEGSTIEQAVTLASSAASVVVQKHGTNFVERWEIGQDQPANSETKKPESPEIGKIELYLQMDALT